MIQKVDYALLGTLAVRDGMLQMESELVSNDKEEIIDRDNYFFFIIADQFRFHLKHSIADGQCPQQGVINLLYHAQSPLPLGLTTVFCTVQCSSIAYCTLTAGQNRILS